jgi:hypothetical protein
VASIILELGERLDDALAQARARSGGRAEGDALWRPEPTNVPQQLAYDSPADEVFFGGAAGCGKTDLLLGLALTRHRRSILFRREYPQLKAIIDRSREIVGGRGRFSGQGLTWRTDDGRQLEFGAVQHEPDKEKYQGRPHDLKAFDELAHFTKSQFQFLIGWTRTTVPGQRCRVVAAGNPPTTPEGRWVVEEWAPWLDPEHPDPARPGELRFYAVLDGKLAWLKSGEPFTRNGELVRPRSRTFIPGRVTDNRYLHETGYVARLQALPEPLRSQMLYGDFTAGTEDDPWQVIPTEWVRAAQKRWTEQGGDGLPLSAVGVDPARGGACKTVLSLRFGTWFAPLHKHAGSTTPDGPAVGALVRLAVGPDKGCAVVLDAEGIGSAVYDALKDDLPGLEPFRGSAGVPRGTADRAGVLTFANARAWSWWSLREALDPARGDGLALPPDPELLADLTAPRWQVRLGGVLVERKEDIISRLGRSPDCGDAVVLAHYTPPGPEMSVRVLMPTAAQERSLHPPGDDLLTWRTW